MQLHAKKEDRLTESVLKLSNLKRLIVTPKYFICCTDGHWLRIVKNIRWVNTNIWGQKVLKSDKNAWTFLNYCMGGTCPECPKSTTPTPMESMHHPTIMRVVANIATLLHYLPQCN